MTVYHFSGSAGSALATGRFWLESAARFGLKAITITRSGARPWRAYNLTIANDHTYFVGKAKAWVHNAGSPCDWPEISFTGLSQNRLLKDLTDADLEKAFHGTGYSLSSHARKRFRDARLAGLGFNTLNDVKQG